MANDLQTLLDVRKELTQLKNSQNSIWYEAGVETGALPLISKMAAQAGEAALELAIRRIDMLISAPFGKNNEKS